MMLRGLALRTAAKDAVTADSRAAIREWLLEPARVERWQEAFDARLKNHERDAVRLYTELLGLVGAERDLLMAFLAGFGLRSVGDFEQVMERTRATEGMDRHASYRVCLDYVTQYRKDEGLPPLVAAGDAEVKEGE